MLISTNLYANRPPRLKFDIRPEPPIRVKPGYYFKFGIQIENRGGKSGAIGINVTFPEGFITSPRGDGEQGFVQFHTHPIDGGLTTRISKDIVATDMPGNYTGNVVIWGRDQSKNMTFDVIVENEQT
jgi:hypothetical protein